MKSDNIRGAVVEVKAARELGSVSQVLVAGEMVVADSSRIFSPRSG